MFIGLFAIHSNIVMFSFSQKDPPHLYIVIITSINKKKNRNDLKKLNIKWKIKIKIRTREEK